MVSGSGACGRHCRQLALCCEQAQTLCTRASSSAVGVQLGSAPSPLRLRVPWGIPRGHCFCLGCCTFSGPRGLGAGGAERRHVVRSSTLTSDAASSRRLASLCFSTRLFFSLTCQGPTWFSGNPSFQFCHTSVSNPPLL